MTVRPTSRIQRPHGRRADRRATLPDDPPQLVRAREPFEQFYRREYRSVVGLAYALSGSRSSSEDLAQEAFMQAHRNWEKVGNYDKPEAWVRRVVANMSVSRFRKRKNELVALARLGGLRGESAVLPELPSEAEEFWAHVRRLPRRQAQTIALHYLEDLSVADIAEILGCSPNTVKVHLHKGRAALAQRLSVDEGGRS